MMSETGVSHKSIAIGKVSHGLKKYFLSVQVGGAEAYISIARQDLIVQS